ncbi:shufflon system plasmid conjugative transfer pilus tip adhesin PilV, partial [Salmonella enterica]|nr:shufflon system plasmid conjugative transfer pilus tip adhesin PilV [Salmonella enterica]
PGHAEYNQMNTALDMNGKNVNRAGNLLVTSDGKSSDDHGSSGSTGFVGWASGSASGTASDATSLRAGMYFSTSAPSSSDKESVWIKTTSNTSLDVTGKVRAATVKGTRLITSEGYLMPGKTVTANTSCTPAALGISDLLADTTGLVAHDSTGATLSCQSGSWKSIGSAAPWTSVTSFTLYPTTTKALGKFKLCVNTYRIDGKETAMTRVWPTDNPDVNGEMNWSAYNGTLYSSYYITVHCFR